METQTEPTFNPAQGRYNRTGILKQFRHISAVTRGGKFTRVSQDAINEIEARAEAKIRSMMDITVVSPVGGSVKKVPGLNLLTGAGKARLLEAFENFICSEMQRFVNDTRTGSTL